ncbi:hypothetical protein ABPG74_002944 [Tetrahymena malaccensis]
MINKIYDTIYTHKFIPTYLDTYIPYHQQNLINIFNRIYIEQSFQILVKLFFIDNIKRSSFLIIQSLFNMKNIAFKFQDVLFRYNVSALQELVQGSLYNKQLEIFSNYKQNNNQINKQINKQIFDLTYIQHPLQIISLLIYNNNTNNKKNQIENLFQKKVLTKFIYLLYAYLFLEFLTFVTLQIQCSLIIFYTLNTCIINISIPYLINLIIKLFHINFLQDQNIIHTNQLALFYY